MYHYSRNFQQNQSCVITGGSHEIYSYEALNVFNILREATTKTSQAVPITTFKYHPLIKDKETLYRNTSSIAPATHLWPWVWAIGLMCRREKKLVERLRCPGQGSRFIANLLLFSWRNLQLFTSPSIRNRIPWNRVQMKVVAHRWAHRNVLISL